MKNKLQLLVNWYTFYTEHILAFICDVHNHSALIFETVTDILPCLGKKKSKVEIRIGHKMKQRD